MVQGLGMEGPHVFPKPHLTLRVQVPNNHILTQNLYYNYYYPNPKYLLIGYMDPLGNVLKNTMGRPGGVTSPPLDPNLLAEMLGA